MLSFCAGSPKASVGTVKNSSDRFSVIAQECRLSFRGFRAISRLLKQAKDAEPVSI
jgi:hypothetical protein